MEQAKKEAILAEASKCFARFGFKKASIDEIARQAGVAKGTVYLAAESKEDLFYQVLHRELRAWIAECAKAIDPRKPADRLLAELVANSTTYLEERPLVRELLFGHAAEILPTWGERLAGLRALGRANIVEVLRIGVGQGVFRPELDVEAAAAVLQDMSLSLRLFRHLSGDSPEHSFKRATLALSIVLDGLRARPAP